MKSFKIIAAISVVSTSLFYSCASELETENNQTELTSNSQMQGRSREICDLFNNATESTLIPGVKAVYIDNGVSTTCHNNILVFPTEQSYEDAIFQLDHMIDNHNDSFDQQTAGMTDEEADDYSDAIGFDEDMPLHKFEDELGFCSLRQNILTLEDDWLNQQGDGAWNLETNPDSHYVEDETERALLSLGSEFIVGNCKVGYKYYKRFDWGTVEIEINDLAALSTLVTALNNIVGPTNINGATLAQVNEVVNASDSPNKVDIKDIGAIIGALQPSTDCREIAKEKGEKVFSSDRRIIWKNKFVRKAGFGNSSPHVRGKSLTKSFRKKKGKWKKYRATISSGFDGVIYNNCSNTVSMVTSKQKKRKRLKELKSVSDLGNYQIHKLKPNALISQHKQEGNYFQDEVY
ncbi:hypothetical protein [Chryseobacterium sp. RLHN22]|uniref:hypothetical protein n=1 Tax=Chryseobacterium sp. RLHN22 TaxID=3437885 RepID=UPI003D9B9B2A